MLYASTPIDVSLLGLYVHQNYTQYCSTLEQCSSLVDDLSWTDANGSGNVGHQRFLNTFMNADDGSSGMTRTRMRFIYRHLEHFIPCPARFRTQDSVSSSLHSSVHCNENGGPGMLWRPLRPGYPVYVACVVLLLDTVGCSCCIVRTLVASGDRHRAGSCAAHGGSPWTAWAPCFFGACIWKRFLRRRGH